MKNTGKRIFIGLFFLLFLVSAAYAKDHFTIMVSCSIPAVPGLNAPIATNKDMAKVIAIKQQDSEAVVQLASAKEEADYIKQQDTKAADKDNNDSGATTVTSVYTR